MVAPNTSRAQEVKGPKIMENVSLGQKKSFTEAPEYTAKMVSEKTGGNFRSTLLRATAIEK